MRTFSPARLFAVSCLTDRYFAFLHLHLFTSALSFFFRFSNRASASNHLSFSVVRRTAGFFACRAGGVWTVWSDTRDLKTCFLLCGRSGRTSRSASRGSPASAVSRLHLSAAYMRHLSRPPYVMPPQRCTSVTLRTCASRTKLRHFTALDILKRSRAQAAQDPLSLLE